MSHQSKTATQAPPHIHLRDNITILVVEDERGHYLVTEHCLRKANILNEVLWFENGQDVLAFLEDDECRREDTKYLLILDIQMPEMNGVEILRRIKSNPALKDVIVIMLTGSDDMELAQHCYTLGCEAYLIKPPGRVLIKTIKRLSNRL